MKPYHPSGVVVDSSGNSVAYLLRKMNRNSLKPEKNPIQPMMFVDANTFKSMVLEDQVQLFQDHGNGPIPDYTEEEVKILLKGLKDKRTLTPEEYWRSEATFYDVVIDVAGAISLCCVCCRKMKMTGAYVVQGAVYSRNMSADLKARIKKSSLFMSQNTSDFVLCNWELTKLEAFVQEYPGYKSVYTKTMTFLDNAIYKVKMPGFMIPPEDDVLTIAERLNIAGETGPGPSTNDGNIIHKMSLG